MCLDIFLAPQAWKWFRQYKMRCILSPIWHERCLVYTSWNRFCVLAGMGWVLATEAEMHFVISLVWDGFGQQKLRYILCPRWHKRCFVNTVLDTFYFLTGIGGVCSTWVKIHFLFSLEWGGFVNACWDAFGVLAVMGWVLSRLADIHFCSRWHDFVNICLDKFCVLAGMVGVW